MAEQEVKLEQLTEELKGLTAENAQLKRALADSTSESEATIAALKSSMECATSEAIDLAERRQASPSVSPLCKAMKGIDRLYQL